MYSKEEAKKLRESFWKAFGQYMRVIPFQAEGRLNWINYNTGNKYVQFKMDVNSKNAYIGVEIFHPDPSFRELIYTQMNELKHVLHDVAPLDWTWVDEIYTDEGKVISKIYQEINSVNVFEKNDWPAIISFLKPRIISLDEFWSIAKYSFDIFK